MTVGRAALIVEALFARVASFDWTGGDLGDPAYPNVQVDPGRTKYLKVDHFPNGLRWEGLSSGRLDQGILQITVVWPTADGLIKPAEVVQELFDHFAKGTQMRSGGVTVTVNKEPVDAPAIIEAAKASIPVTISWVA